MPTTKTRINLSVPDNVEVILHKLARRDDISVSSKALDLLKRGIELEEDDLLLDMAMSRESKKKVRYFSHENAWK